MPTLQLITDSEPAREQMARYTKMLVAPCVGATWKMRNTMKLTAKAV